MITKIIINQEGLLELQKYTLFKLLFKIQDVIREVIHKKTKERRAM